MTNLTQKFTAFETQSAQQATDIIAAINALTTLLTPPEGAATLADLLAVLQETNGYINDIRFSADAIETHTRWMYNYWGEYLAATAQNTAQVAENVGFFGIVAHNDAVDIKFDLDNIHDRLFTMLSLVNDTIQATACPCETGAPVLAPPLSDAELTASAEERCKRVQAFLAMFGRLIDSIANLGGAGTAITASTLGALLIAAAEGGGLIGGEVGAVAGPPGVIAGAIIGALTAAVGALGAAALQTLATQWHTEPLIEQLRDALYDVSDAASGDIRFHAVVNASGVLTTPWRQLVNTLWWSSWSNDLYNDGVTIDTSGFDGTICQTSTPPGPDCADWPQQVMTWTSDEMVTISTPYGNRLVPNWAKYGIQVVDDGRPGEYSAVMAPCEVWSYSAIGNTLQFYQSDPDPNLNAFNVLPDPAGTIGNQSSKLIFWSYRDPWSLTLTPPA
jgi:hypothetical protein